MTDHAALAEQYFKSGCNCAQSVICAFSDCTGLDFTTSMKLGSSLGGGFGRMREVCGAFSGACIVAGLLWGYTDPAAKKEKADHYALIQDMAARFKKLNGSIICRELLAGVESSTESTPSDRTAEYYKKRPCAQISALAAGILDEIIAEQGFTNTDVLPLGTAKDYRFVVIFARMNGQWIYARAKDRLAWETAGGHIEKGETSIEAAKRELWEETGASAFTIRPMFDYSVRVPDDFAYGQVFLADVTQLDTLPEEFEMEEIGFFDSYPSELRFPTILPILYRKIIELC